MLAGFLSSVIHWLSAHSHIAYIAVFLLALSESIPIMGVVVPGTAVIIALSALVPNGVLLLWPLMAAATFGAIVGDGLSFWLGHRYHREILCLWPLKRYPELIERSEAFFKRHGDKSVFIARFAPGVRAFIPLLAGMLGMPVRRFYSVNITSALVWAPSHILPGVLVGVTFGALGSAARPLAILLVILLATGWVTWRLGRWVLRRGFPLLEVLVTEARRWSETRNTWLSRRVGDMLDPARPEAWVLAIMLGLLGGAAWLFLGILEDVVNGDPLVLADHAIYNALQEVRTPLGDAIMVAITEIGDTKVVVVVTTVIFLWLAWKRAWRTAAFWLAAVGGASALNTVIKVALHRARPDELLYSGWSAFSFPSGHSTTNMALYGFLAFLIAGELRPALRVLIGTGAAVLIFMIACSRLYLGAHWFSDVAGGAAVGSAWFILLAIFYLRRPVERIGSSALLVTASAAIILAGAGNIYHSHSTDIARYAAKNAIHALAVADWWTTGWQTLPDRRVDLTGEVEEPLTFQWAGSLQGLQDLLQQDGWRPSLGWTPVTVLKWLTASTDTTVVPVVPHFASGRLPDIAFVRSSTALAPSTARLVLRLWETDMKLEDREQTPLWVGSITEERIYRLLSLVTMVSTQPDFTGPREALARSLREGHLVSRDEVEAKGGWDGRVLLARQKASHPPPLLPSNPAQPVGSGADPRNKCRVSNWLEPSRL
ncbi:phosphatase PAP2 family protein [Rhizobium sp. NZLR1b]|uniref:bifunctional DedA family/phosphatase PAP2 family protein n=2 Tax=unclassified Rhizobium TaxID=2613769 RepID=UPI001C831D2B|nr:bifunctional DedA family/phosphatase PAP2 family protein [Rhizobium sp. NZLR1b]MBX5174519.1 phosphatase PAP2 family protein [Rhizobium sp. NZLR1b]